MKPQPYTLLSPKTAAFSTCSKNECVREKEVAYEATFTKRNSVGDVEFRLPVTEELIDHWVDTFDRMKAAGIPVPVPLGHSTKAENRVGKVVELEKRFLPERDGKASLFTKIEFKSPEVAEKFEDSDVSLYMEPQFHSGLDEPFIRPIRHVCITDYPVIPDLKPFNAAMSFSLDEGGNSMDPMIQLAEDLGIPLPEGATAEDAAEAIRAQFAALQEPDQDSEMPEEGVEEDTAVSEEEPLPEDDVSMPEEEEEEEEFPPQKAMAFSQTVLKSVEANRQMRLRTLVGTGQVTPAVAKALESMYCTREAVHIALSLEESGFPPDDFDGVVKALSLAPKTRIAAKTTTLEKAPEQSGLIRNALKRAEAAAKVRR